MPAFVIHGNRQHLSIPNKPPGLRIICGRCASTGSNQKSHPVRNDKRSHEEALSLTQNTKRQRADMRSCRNRNALNPDKVKRSRQFFLLNLKAQFNGFTNTRHERSGFKSCNHASSCIKPRGLVTPASTARTGAMQWPTMAMAPWDQGWPTACTRYRRPTHCGAVNRYRCRRLPQRCESHPPDSSPRAPPPRPHPSAPTGAGL